MIPLAVLIVGAWLQWKAYRLAIHWATRPVTDPEVGRAFQALAHRHPEGLARWFEDIAPSPWEATGELPVVRVGDGAVDVQPRLGEA